MKKTWFLVLGLSLVFSSANSAMAEVPWDHGKLKVSENGRFVQHANGKPFFWLADTVWLLFQKMDRDEVTTYFSNRKSKGFNVVQCIALQNLTDVNIYGDPAVVEKNITRFNVTPGKDPAKQEQYDYWDHVDYVVDVALQNGIYLAIAPVWGHMIRREAISKEMAEKFATTLAVRLKDKPNIIWVNGGSIRGDVKTEIWEAIGKSIKKQDPNHLMTFHPFGRTQSSTWFHASSWLDVNMFTSGHRRYDQDDSPQKIGQDNFRYVGMDWAKTPPRPTLDGEPAYEDTPQGLHDLTQPYWNANDARRYAYWSVFAGACGHTYGHNAVRQVYKKSDAKSSSGAKTFFHESLDTPAASQLQHLKALMLSRPYFDRVGESKAVSVDEGEKYDRILATRGKDYLFAYTYTGRSFKLELGSISGTDVTAWWFNPRTGKVTKLGKFKNKGTKSFDPPGKKAEGSDWVLVLDDASRGFAAPAQLP